MAVISTMTEKQIESHATTEYSELNTFLNLIKRRLSINVKVFEKDKHAKK